MKLPHSPVRLLLSFLIIFTSAAPAQPLFSLSSADLSSYNPKTKQVAAALAKATRLYRAEERHWDESSALKVLLQPDGIALRSRLVWKLLLPQISQCPDRTSPEYDACEQPVLRQILDAASAQLARQDIPNLLHNKGDDSLSRDFLLYTTPHQNIAAHYGRYIFTLEPKQQRGVIIGLYNKELNKLKPPAPLNINPQRIVKEIACAVADLDEVAIPLAIPNSDVVQVEVRTPAFGRVNNNGTLLEGSLLRRYQKTIAGVLLQKPGALPGKFTTVGMVIVGDESRCPEDFPVPGSFAGRDREWEEIPQKLWVSGQGIALCMPGKGK